MPAPVDESRTRAAAPEAAGLAGVLGQEAAVGTLRAALRAGRLHHAYLFDGPEGVGKATCARALFVALNCQAAAEGCVPAPGDACGRCEACRKALAGTHPDLIVFDMTLAGLADEAERLVRRLGFRPHEGQVQLVLFDPADNFSAPTAVTAANRLLKTLEEPIDRTLFVLVSSAAQSLLPTIRSRTQRLRFGPLPDELLRRELVERHGVAEDLVGPALRLGQGSLGRALQLLADPEGLRRRESLAERLWTAMGGRRAQEIVEISAEAGSDREEAQKVLELLWLRLHRELLPGAGGRRAAVLLRAAATVREAAEAIRRFTSPQLSLERMLRKLQEGGRA